jgi:serine/threonine protein phosphatase PrpC
VLGQVDCHGITDVGRERESNQDQYLVADLQKSMRVHYTSLGVEDQTRLYGGSQGKLFLVADGMGGHAAGERASSLAVDCVIEYLLNTTHSLFRLHEDSADDDVFCDDLKAAFDHCQTKYNAEVQAMPNRRGMGTTLTIAYVVWPRLYVVHVGDSRAYLFRGSHLEQITKDHTVAQEYVDNGFMSEAEAKTSRLSHMRWNTVGDDSCETRPEVHKAELQMGDKLLICTDGLTRHVSDNKLAAVLQLDQRAEKLCAELIQMANEAGGSDNITAIVAQFKETEGELMFDSQEASTADKSVGIDTTSPTRIDVR